MGMSYVQQWLAHLSPEMTLVYARVSEDTMRKQWEEAMTFRVSRESELAFSKLRPD